MASAASTSWRRSQVTHVGVRLLEQRPARGGHLPHAALGVGLDVERGEVAQARGDAAVGLQPRDEVDRLGGRALGLGLLAREALHEDARPERPEQRRLLPGEPRALLAELGHPEALVELERVREVERPQRGEDAQQPGLAQPLGDVDRAAQRPLRAAEALREHLPPAEPQRRVQARGQVRVLEPRVAGLGLRERGVARRPVGLPLGAEPVERGGRDHEREVVGRVGEPFVDQCRIPAPSEANAQLTARWTSSVARSSGAASSSAAARRRPASA